VLLKEKPKCAFKADDKCEAGDEEYLHTTQHKEKFLCYIHHAIDAVKCSVSEQNEN